MRRAAPATATATATATADPLEEDDWDGYGIGPQQLKERGISCLEEYLAVRCARRRARDALEAVLRDPTVPGRFKGWARCAYLHEHGRVLFQCPGCWLLPGNCVCRALARFELSRTRVIVSVGYEDWGKGSNTGCLLAASLTGAELLLRGHAPHDERLAKLLADCNSTPVLLWPDEDALTPEELRQLADAQSGGHVTLVALDASWDGARRMRSHFPPGVRTLRLPPGLALPGAAEDEHVGSSAGGGGSGSAAGRGSMAHGLHGGGGGNQQQLPMLTDEAGVRVSLLRPLRKYPHAHKTGRVSTLEAVAAALLALEDDGANTVLYAGLLRNLTLKVDAARRQKHMPEIFHTMNDSN